MCIYTYIIYIYIYVYTSKRDRTLLHFHVRFVYDRKAVGV